MLNFLPLLLASLTSTAEAKCENHISKVKALKGKAVVAEYKKLLRCDKQMASDTFTEFMKRSTSVEDLSALSNEAIAGDAWTPVGKMPNKIISSKIPNKYDVSSKVTDKIGSMCSSNAKIVGFLQSSFITLGDNDFAYWKGAYINCKSPDLDKWMAEKVANPPQRTFAKKYTDLLTSYVKKHKEKAIPQLEQAALKAAEKGPFNDILNQLTASIEPEGFDSTPKPAHKTALENAFLKIAKGIKNTEKTRVVADKLANAGSETKAAELLPTLFPKRKSGKYYTYGISAIETADCDGTKTAVIHYAEVKEPGKRWFIINATQDTIRASAPKLSKCKPIDSTWTVTLTPEPIKSKGDLSSWLKEMESQYKNNKYKVSTKKEKKITLD